jgi:hypothetical protein
MLNVSRFSVYVSLRHVVSLVQTVHTSPLLAPSDITLYNVSTAKFLSIG